jgi:CDP-diacylglycerol--glycerol-3-phosphate 3-phosphatidyltransferase
MNLANWISLSRLLLLPLALLPVTLGWREGWLTLAGVNALAGASDFADGYLSRRLKLSTPRGASLDLLSDKIYISGMFIALATYGLISWWIPLVVIMRELAVTLLRLRHPHEGVMKVDFWGKLKTFVSFMAVGWVALDESLRSGALLKHLDGSGILSTALSAAPWAVMAAVLLTLASGLHYLWKYTRLPARE